MTGLPVVLVTGAEEHQGLSVIRGLGRAGFPVLACGSNRGSMGFRSRHARWAATYRSPHDDSRGFVADVLDAAKTHAAAIILPAVESTLVALNAARAETDAVARLAAPAPAVLDVALDKVRTLQLAGRVGVPVPRTVRGDTAVELLDAAARMHFPVAVKPRGPRAYAPTAHRLPFKSRYARTLDELAAIVADAGADVPALLVQEYAPGGGRCVVAVCDHGVPLVLFAYDRDREYPYSGGVSVMRRSIPLDDTLRRHVVALLGASRWHGVAMVEFRHDARHGALSLMEINGRFQASTALSLSAGLNLPALTARLFLGGTTLAERDYRIGLRQRWLRGDLLALVHRWEQPDAAQGIGRRPPTRWAALWQFIRDTNPTVRLDEITADDLLPGLLEFASIAGLASRATGRAVRDLMRSRRQSVGVAAEPDADSAPASAAVHRSMRA